MSQAFENPEDIPQLCRKCKWLNTCDGVTPHEKTAAKIYCEEENGVLYFCDGFIEPASTYWGGNKLEALKFAISAIESLRNPEKNYPAQLLIYNATINELTELVQEMEANA